MTLVVDLGQEVVDETGLMVKWLVEHQRTHSGLGLIRTSGQVKALRFPPNELGYGHKARP